MRLFSKLAMITIFAVIGYAGTLHAGKPSQTKQLPKKESKMDVLSWKPRVFYFHNFLSDEECDLLISKARPELKRSTVVDLETEGGKIHEARTSQGMFLAANHQDPVITGIEERISRLTQIPMENGESIQVLSYGVGGEYKPHYDYFDGSTPGGALCLNRGGQRVASFIMYLNTPQAGGETIFPQAHISVTPKKGDAVLFYDCLPNGNIDPLTLHGGAPVIAGEKWIATRWLRQGMFR